MTKRNNPSLKKEQVLFTAQPFPLRITWTYRISNSCMMHLLMKMTKLSETFAFLTFYVDYFSLVFISKIIKIIFIITIKYVFLLYSYNCEKLK